MNVNDELKQLGEPTTSPEEEAEAQRLDEQLDCLRRGEWPNLHGDPNAKTLSWVVEHAQTVMQQADHMELEELGGCFPQFELLERLDVGGMGVVYRAREIVFNVPVALKVIRPEFSNDPEFLARFKTEVRAMAHLNHSNI